MHHWSQKIENEAKHPSCFRYNGLTFPKYCGLLSREEQRSGKTFYAFYGGIPLSEQAIKYHVDNMISKGLIEAA